MYRNYIKYIIALLLFGSNGIVASYLPLSSYEIVLYRTFIGSIFLCVIVMLSTQKLQCYKYPRPFLNLTISGVAMGCSWMFLYEAYQQIGVSVASLAYYCGPVIVMAVSPFLFHSKIHKNIWLGFSAVLLGIVLVNVQLVTEGNVTTGLLCGLASAVMYAFMVIFKKKSSEITGLESASLQLLISFLTVAIFVGVTKGYHFTIHRSELFPLLFLGVVNTGIGCYLYFSSIGKLELHSVSILGYLEPLSAVIFSVILLHEKLHVIQIIGAVCIISGAVYSELKSTK